MAAVGYSEVEVRYALTAGFVSQHRWGRCAFPGALQYQISHVNSSTFIYPLKKLLRPALRLYIVSPIDNAS